MKKNPEFDESIRFTTDDSSARLYTMDKLGLTYRGTVFAGLSDGERKDLIVRLQKSLDNQLQIIAKELNIEPCDLTAENIHQLSGQIAANKSLMDAINQYNSSFHELAEYRHIRGESEYQSSNRDEWPKSPFELAFKNQGLEPFDD